MKCLMKKKKRLRTSLAFKVKFTIFRFPNHQKFIDTFEHAFGGCMKFFEKLFFFYYPTQVSTMVLISPTVSLAADIYKPKLC